MKSKLLVLAALVFAGSISQAASLSTPAGTMQIVSKDGAPISNVSATGMLLFSVLSVKDCTDVICIPSLPYYKNTGAAGQVLGSTNLDGQMIIPAKNWETSALTAKDLRVNFFVNGLKDVFCDEKGTQLAGYVEVIPQWIDNKLYERNYECTGLTFNKDDKKEIMFKCISPFTSAEIQQKVNTVKEQNCTNN